MNPGGVVWDGEAGREKECWLELEEGMRRTGLSSRARFETTSFFRKFWGEANDRDYRMSTWSSTISSTMSQISLMSIRTSPSTSFTFHTSPRLDTTLLDSTRLSRD